MRHIRSRRLGFLARSASSLQRRRQRRLTLESLEAKVVLDASSIALDGVPDEVENQAPIAIDDIYQLAAGTRRVEFGREQGVLRNDFDPDANPTNNEPTPITAKLLAGAVHGEVQLFERGGFEYIAPEGFSGVDSFEYRAFDGELYSEPAVVRIFVGNQNHPPVAEDNVYDLPASGRIEVGRERGVLSNDFDPDGDELTAHLLDPNDDGIAPGEWLVGPEHGELRLNENGSFVYEAFDSFPGEDFFVYFASDGELESNIAFVHIIGEHRNDPPIAEPDRYERNAIEVVEVGVEGGVLANDFDPNGDPLTAHLVEAPFFGEVELRENGSFRYVPGPEDIFFPEVSFSYLASDGNSESNIARVTLFFGGQNGAPEAESDRYEMPAGTAALEVGPERGVLANDFDPDGDRLVADLVEGPQFGEVVLHDDGSFRYVRNANHPVNADGDSFAYVASDGSSRSNVARVFINFGQSENHAPQAESDHYEMATGAIDLEVGPDRGVLANDSDPDGDPIFAELAEDAQFGDVILNDDGSFLYVRDATNVAPDGDSFTYIANDGSLTSNVARVFISFNLPGNHAPHAESDGYEIGSNGRIEVGVDRGVLANDSDPDGDNLTAHLASDPATTPNGDVISGPRFGEVVLRENGSFVYEAGPIFPGFDSFAYYASDGDLRSNVAIVRIGGEPANHAPIAESDRYELPSSGVLEVGPNHSVLLNDSDPDGDPLTAHLADGPITTGHEDGTAITLIDGPLYGELRFREDGTFIYEAFDSFTGFDAFAYYASDGELLSNVAIVRIVGEPANHAPHAESDRYEISARGRLEIGVDRGVLANDSDPDGDQLTARLVNEAVITPSGEVIGGPRFGTVSLREDGSFVYEAGPDFPGFDAFAYYASDGELRSNVAIVRIGSEPVNHPPVAESDEYRLPNSGRLEVSPADGVLANDSDPDGDELTAHLVDAGIEPDPNGNIPNVIVGPLHGEVHLREDGSFVYEAFDSFPGHDTFTYIASDGELRSNFAVVRIFGEPANHAPVAEPDRYELAVGQQVLEVGAERGVLANDFDPDGDRIFADLVEPPRFGVVELNENGSFRYFRDDATVAPNGDSFAYVASDGGLRSGITRVFISFSEPTNHAPRAENDGYEISASGRIEVGVERGVLANDSDPDGDRLTAHIVVDPIAAPNGDGISGPRFGTVVLRENGSFVYEAGPAFPGFDSFAYYASDGELQSNIAVVRIGGEPANHAPIAESDRYEVQAGGSLTVGPDRGLLHNDFDPDGDRLTVEQIVPPELPDVVHGRLELRPDGSFVYTPPENFRGTDTFFYVASDGALRSEVAPIEFVVESETQTRTLDIGERAAPAGETVSVPIVLNRADDLLAADLLIRFDANLLSTSSAGVRLGRLAANWHLFANVDVEAGVIDVSMFGTELLRSVDGALLWIDFQVSPNAAVGDTAAIEFVEASLNEGRLESATSDGGVRVTRSTLRVRDTRPNRSGVSISISDRADASALNLFRGLDNPNGVSDVTLVGENTGPVHGSLHLNENTQELEFVRTGGALVPDTYTLTIRSGSDGLHGTDGENLDGDADGEAGGNFVTRFIVEESEDRMLGVPDFVRAAGQQIALKGTGGLPIHLDNGAGVTEVAFTLAFDPAALNVTGALLGNGVPGDWQIDSFDVGADGRAVVRASGVTPLNDGDSNPIVLTASVSAAAVSGSTHLVRLEDVSLNNGSLAATGDQALQVVALFGDVTGNGDFSSLDASFISRVAVGLDSGFDDYGLIDPMLLADVTGDGTVSALDAAWIARKAAGLPQDEILDAPAPQQFSASLATPAPLPQLGAIAATLGQQTSSPVASREPIVTNAEFVGKLAQIDLTWVTGNRDDRSSSAEPELTGNDSPSQIDHESPESEMLSSNWESSVAKFFADLGGNADDESAAEASDSTAGEPWDFLA